MKLEDFFIKDLDPGQRRYEAMRATDFKEGTAKEIAKRFDATTLPEFQIVA
jgi:hypothetical protein